MNESRPAMQQSPMIVDDLLTSFCLPMVVLFVSLDAGAHAIAQPPALKPSADVAPTTQQNRLTIEQKTKVHRLTSTKRSRFDAFVYVNRIPDRPTSGETPADLVGRIFGRLANQEGRILLKVPPQMTSEAYRGFKTFLRAEGDSSVGNCAVCHTLPDFTDRQRHIIVPGKKPELTPSLRNQEQSRAAIRKRLAEIHPTSKPHRSVAPDNVDKAILGMNLAPKDVSEIAAFLEILDDVPDAEFRNLILGAKLLDTSGEIE